MAIGDNIKKTNKIRKAIAKKLGVSSTLDNDKNVNIQLSVVIPVFNTMPYLTELLNSLEAQTLSSEKFEVIAVNDGSTDFSDQILDVYAKRNSNFKIIHQKNSGWPGKPRNIGIQEARGEYVLFCDGDDVIGPEALERMCNYSKDNDVDVLIPKMVGLGGRRVMSQLYTVTRLDTPLDVAMRSLNPIKMIRRSLLLDNNIRFKEEPVRLEDGMAIVQAYMVAKRISILSDYDYYQARTRQDGQNISVRRIDPAGYVESLTNIAETIETHTETEYAHKLISELFIRKGLRFYGGNRFLKYDTDNRWLWINKHAEFLYKFLPQPVEEYFSGTHRERVRAIIENNLAKLETMAKTDVEKARRPRLLTVEHDENSINVKIRNFALDQSVKSLVVEDRDSKVKTFYETCAAGSPDEVLAKVNISSIVSNIERLGDFWLEYYNEKKDLMRVEMGEDISNVTVLGVRFYRTAHGSFSVDVRKAMASEPNGSKLQ